MPSNGSANDVFPDNVPDCHRVIAELRKKLEDAEQRLKVTQELNHRIARDLANYRQRQKE